MNTTTDRQRTPAQRGPWSQARVGRRLHVAFDLAPNGMVFLDPAGRVLDANQAFGRLVGRLPTELRGRRYTELLAEPDQLPEAERLLRLLDGDDAPGVASCRFRHGDASTLARVAIVVIRRPDGRPDCLAAHVDVVTEPV